MKNKLAIFSVILVLSMMVAGGTFAWFTSSPDPSLTNITMGIVDVQVLQDGIDNITVKSLGTTDSYVRVRLVPQWSDPNLSVANVNINIGHNWIEDDGYYYYAHPLTENQETSNIVTSIDYGTLTPEYEGASFTLKIVAEGVQSAHKAWRDVWSINNLPF